MKMWVAMSLGIHLAVGGVFSTRPAPTRNLTLPGKVYSVSLVSLPAARRAQSPPAAPQAKAVEAQPKVETVKKEPPKKDPEAVKPPSAKPKPKKEEPAPKATVPKEPEEKKADEKDVPREEVTPSGASASAAADSGAATVASGVEGGSVVASALGATNTQGSVSLDVANFGFSYYLVALQAKVASNWFPPGSVGAPGEVLRATVRFRIVRSGAIEGAVVERSSGVPYFDRCALRAILLSSPLAPLPSEFEEEDLGVHFEFSHTVSLR